MEKQLGRTELSILKGLITTIALLSIGIACGAPKRFAVDSNQLTLSNSGIVFGRATNQRFYGLGMYNAESFGRSLGIKNKNTGESFTYTSAHYFEMRLPEGTYQIVKMSTVKGGIIPRTEPFEFNIRNGEIKYIGSIVADRDLARHLKKISVHTPILGVHVFSVKDYGERETRGLLLKETGRAREPFFTFFIINESEDVIAEFNRKYPSLQAENITVDFMK
jgi:hypothetical protein